MATWNTTSDDAVYKPILSVEVPGEEVSGSLNVTPKTSQTPHVSTNIFVAGLPASWDENDLKEHYKKFGDIVSTKVVKNRHFGFVMFRRPESAHKAINETHLTKPIQQSSTVLHVSMAMHDEGVDEEPNNRLFVRGLPQWVTKEHLNKSFQLYGQIEECAVLMNPLGQCKGSGFVQFSAVDEATAAVRDRENIHIDNWCGPLEIKYSETADVRKQRQERNRQRQKCSPKFKSNNSNSTPATPFFQSYSQPVSILPSPQAFPMMSYSVMCSPQVANTPHVPTPVVYSNPMTTSLGSSSGSPLFSQPYVVVNPTTFPSKGDLLLAGGPLSEDLVRMLVQPYGVVENILAFDGTKSFAVRMSDSNSHPIIAQNLDGTLFSTGQVLKVVLCV